jgi:hypothetical protein
MDQPALVPKSNETNEPIELTKRALFRVARFCIARVVSGLVPSRSFALSRLLLQSLRNEARYFVHRDSCY